MVKTAGAYFVLVLHVGLVQTDHLLFARTGLNPKVETEI